MPPTDVVSKATEVSWVAGLLALLVVVLAGLVTFHYRGMWIYIRDMSHDAQDVIDDNTLAWLQVARVLAIQPRLHDSDPIATLQKSGVKPEDFAENESHVRRVLDRREKRRVEKTK